MNDWLYHVITKKYKSNGINSQMSDWAVKFNRI